MSKRYPTAFMCALSVLAFGLPAITQFAAAASSKAFVPPRDQSALRRDSNLILFRRGSLDTSVRLDLDTSAGDLASFSPTKSQRSSRLELRVVQFAGPIKRRWFLALKATGAEVLGYIPNYAYIIRGGAAELSSVASLDGQRLADDARPIRWMGRPDPEQKLDPVFEDSRLNGAQAGTANVEVELVDWFGVNASVERINTLSAGGVYTQRRFLNFVVLSARVPLARMLDIASLDDVLFIGPAPGPKPLDEVSAQIAAGNFEVGETRPAGPGYSTWLSSLGLDFTPDFVVDVADTGLDRGFTSPDLIHPDFLDLHGNGRVAYSLNYAEDGQIDDRLGHGSLVSSILAGLGSTSRVDPAGYMYGMGIDRYLRLGASRIFDHTGATPTRLSFASVATAAYSLGARIENNSWGSDGNSYNSMAQEYDLLTRDADPGLAGNQEMTFIFAAGNTGPNGHINSPAVAKNVIAVAASESYRPEGTDSCNLDGQGSIGPDGADNALDILRYSSGGPTSDGRAKPDIAAPGTHVYGAASRSRLFFGVGLCPGATLFQPPGQNLYTWSSGTSMSTPHVAGAAALVRKFFTSRDVLGDNRPPSPAMIKAFLINSATYMTGEYAGGTLPSARQGWGLLDLSRAFDSTRRSLVDQTHLFTESGQSFEIQGSLADRTKPLRVTLAWTDPPAPLAGPALVNDLDLEVKIGETVIYRGNNFADEFSVQDGDPDRLNNVESIYVPPSAFPEDYLGNFTITVRAYNIAGNGVPGNDSEVDQDFALVVYNIESAILPPPPGKQAPVITDAQYVKKNLTITGHDFTSAARVEINGKPIKRPFTFDSSTNSFSIKLKRKKLNLNKDADNRIVLIEDGLRSDVFILTL